MYRGALVTAVDHLCLGIPRGECFGLLGINGKYLDSFCVITRELLLFMSLQGGARLPPRVSQNISQTLITFTLIKKFHFNCSLDFVNKKWFNSMRYFTCMQLLVIPSREYFFLLPLLN